MSLARLRRSFTGESTFQRGWPYDNQGENETNETLGSLSFVSFLSSSDMPVLPACGAPHLKRAIRHTQLRCGALQISLLLFECDSFSHIFRCASNHFQSDTERERAMNGAFEPVIAPVGHL